MLCELSYDSDNDINIGERLTNRAWELLVRYIANNTHLKTVSLRSCGISDEKMALLFSELTSSCSISKFDVGNIEFGIEGLRSMIPYMRNSPQLINLDFGGNNNINTECFEVLISALDGKTMPIEKLSFGSCNITDISSLETYNLPNLQQLVLSYNSIGREGCRTLSNLLRQESGSGLTLTHLYLSNTGMGDEEAELLASSLKHNTKLKLLSMTQNNNITERGKGAFLKLLLDASSIENIYNSNRTLTTLWYSADQGVRSNNTSKHVQSAIQINKTNTNSEKTGRSKVIKYQLNSQRRKELCLLQGVEYSSIGNLFADIEPHLLPHILALIGREHGQSEFYTALIPMVPDLMSYINRRALIDDIIAENSRDITALEAEYAMKKLALTTKRDELHNRRACMESEADTQGNNESDEQKVVSCGGKKRRI